MRRTYRAVFTWLLRRHKLAATVIAAVIAWLIGFLIVWMILR